MRVLITGATGAIGTSLLDWQGMRSHELALLNRHRLDTDLPQILIESVGFPSAAIRDFDPEIVLHLAGDSTVNPVGDQICQSIKANLEFGSLLLDSLVGSSLQRLILAGSATEYSEGNVGLDPTYFFSAMKTAFRSVTQHFQKRQNFSVMNCILYWVYGAPGKQRRFIDLLIEAAHRNEELNCTPGLQELDFIHVDDVCECFFQVLNHPEWFTEPYQELFVGTGVTTSLCDLALVTQELLGQRLRINWGAIPYRPSDIQYSRALIERNWRGL